MRPGRAAAGVVALLLHRADLLAPPGRGGWSLVGGPPQAAEENLPIPSAMLGIEAGEWAIPCAGVRNRGGRSPNPDS